MFTQLPQRLTMHWRCVYELQEFVVGRSRFEFATEICHINIAMTHTPEAQSINFVVWHRLERPAVNVFN